MKRRTPEVISDIMRKVRSRDTTPELRLRKALFAQGLRYRIHPSHLIGRPDLVFASKRLCLFVDGDYWHGNQWSRRRLTRLEDQFPDSERRSYWIAKIRRNMRRDALVTATLLADGWKVLRLWESDLRRDLAGRVEAVMAALDAPAQASPDTEADALALLPRMTVAAWGPRSNLLLKGLEPHGWSVVHHADFSRPDPWRHADAHHPVVTLSTASLPDERDEPSGTSPAEGGALLRFLAGNPERKPPLALLEMATAPLAHRGGAALEAGCLALSEAGYAVDTCLALSEAGYAVDVFTPVELGGASPGRQRLFLLGVQRGLLSLTWAAQASSFRASDARPTPLLPFIAAYPGIDWHLRALPSPSRIAPEAAETEEARIAAVEWLAQYYLNPLVNELLRGRVIQPL